MKAIILPQVLDTLTKTSGAERNLGRALDGSALLARVSALRLEGLFDGDELSATLLAAVFAEALRTGETPRRVLDALWESLPPDDAWEAVAETFSEACDETEGGD